VKVLHKSASYRYISSNDIESIRKEIDEMNKSLVPLKEIMQVHQVVSVSKGKVKTCTTSCYCKDCVMGNLHDCSKGGLFKSSRRPQSCPNSYFRFSLCANLDHMISRPNYFQQLLRVVRLTHFQQLLPVILYVSRKDVICRIEETKVVGRSFKITDDGAKTIQEK
jgi:hypothetical protein